MEKKGSIARPELLSKIAQHLNTSVDYLLGRTSNPTPIGDNMRLLDEREAKLIDQLSKIDRRRRNMIFNMVSVAIASFNMSENDDDAILYPNDGKTHHSRTSVDSRENIENKAVLGNGVAGDDRYFIVRAVGDSMADAGIHDGDYCAFDREADQDYGLIMLVQIEGMTEQPGGMIKRVYFHADRNIMELRSANPAYDPMYFPMDEVTLIGVLATVLSPKD